MTRTKLIPIRTLKIKDGKLEMQVRFYPLTMEVKEEYNQEIDEFDYEHN